MGSGPPADTVTFTESSAPRSNRCEECPRDAATAAATVTNTNDQHLAVDPNAMMVTEGGGYAGHATPDYQKAIDPLALSPELWSRILDFLTKISPSGRDEGSTCCTP